MVRDPFLASAKKALTASLADRIGAAGVLVLGCHVTDAGVQPDRVVVDALALELDLQLDGIADL
ncbi:MAG: hypothetical protein GEU90_23260, partial [Gemmatimonas sp.]|nr:hypothetical protein [Gemmatimonas sp.]